MGREGLKKELKKKILKRIQKSKIQIEKNLSYKNSLSSFQQATRKQIPSNPACSPKQITPPSWLSLRVSQPQFKNWGGHSRQPQVSFTTRSKELFSVESKGLRSPRFLLHPPLVYRERERMKNKERRLLFEATCVTMEDWRRRCIHSHLPQGWPRSYARPGNSLCRNVKRVERVTKDSGVNESLKRETRGWHT